MTNKNKARASGDASPKRRYVAPTISSFATDDVRGVLGIAQALTSGGGTGDVEAQGLGAVATTWEGDKPTPGRH